MPPTTWSAPVRYSEADQQGVAFNAHYLLWCDEAMGAFCTARGLSDLVQRVRLKTSTLTWHSPARWGDTVEVVATCTRVGTTSLTIHFEVAVAGRPCCTIETVYVDADTDGRPAPITEADRAALLA